MAFSLPFPIFANLYMSMILLTLIRCQTSLTFT